ncbi:MAG: UDP-N-acetylmuramate dehydrogenase [Burkholderiales bacterium]
MVSRVKKDWCGELRFDEPLGARTTWRTGGVARCAYLPRNVADLALFLKDLPADEPLWFIGLGSNILVRDGGLPGTAILLHNALKHMRVVPDAEFSIEMHDIGRKASGSTLYVEAGVASAKVARFAVQRELGGAEFLVGIPGTLGGALAMNAGCFGAQTWDVVAMVRTLDRHGRLATHTPEDFDIGYRHVALKKPRNRRMPMGGPQADQCFVAAWLSLKSGQREALRGRLKQFLAQRIATQPLDVPSAGSVFRNPPGDYAARLIEACGLKGRAIGGAMVSPRHANFIVNTGGATAADIEAMIDLVRDVVRREQGVDLASEVRIIGVS